MNDIKALLARISGRTERPENYEDLLLIPLADKDTEVKNPGVCYPGWENHHWLERRFFLAGMGRFRIECGLPFTKFDAYRTAAHDKILKDKIWHGPNAGPERWADVFGRPKLEGAWARHPVSFETAAKTLLACELAAEAQIEKTGTGPGGIKSAGEIYGRLGIFPAVWNIVGWGPEYIEEAEREVPTFYRDLRDAVGLEEIHVIHDLKTKHTVSRALAEAVGKSAWPGRKYPLGKVRASPGTHAGTGVASHNEALDLG